MSTETPADGQEFTFSASVARAKVAKISLDDLKASACCGTPRTKAYMVQWVSYIQPGAAVGLNLPPSKLTNLFSEPQIRTLRAFMGLQKTNILVQAVTRIQLPSFEQAWSSMTAMPHPTLAPYPFYSCVYVEAAKVFRAITQIPAVEDVTIKHHHQHREHGWLSMGDGGFDNKPNIFHQIPSPFTFFINEREYEVTRMIGILREAEASKQNATRQWNGR